MNGAVTTVRGSGNVKLGNPPVDLEMDWVVVIQYFFLNKQSIVKNEEGIFLTCFSRTFCL